MSKRKWAYDKSASTWSSRLLACAPCRRANVECVVQFAKGRVMLCDRCRGQKRRRNDCHPGFDRGTQRMHKEDIKRGLGCLPAKRKASAETSLTIVAPSSTNEDEVDQTNAVSQEEDQLDESKDYITNTLFDETLGELKNDGKVSSVTSTTFEMPVSACASVAASSVDLSKYPSSSTLGKQARSANVHQSPPAASTSSKARANLTMSAEQSKNNATAQHPVMPSASTSQSLSAKSPRIRGKRAKETQKMPKTELSSGQKVLEDIRTASHMLEQIMMVRQDGKVDAGSLETVWRLLKPRLERAITLVQPRSALGPERLTDCLDFMERYCSTSNEGQVDVSILNAVWKNFLVMFEQEVKDHAL